MTARKPDEKAQPPAEQQSFEKAMERLEKVVREMESGSLSLDTMIARFEEGQALISFCNTKLNEVERKIEILVRKGDEIVAEPFESDAEEPTAPQDEDAGLPF